MTKASFGGGDRSGTTWLQCIGLAIAALLAIQLIALFPAARSAGQDIPWRDRDYAIWYHAHQLFRCGPEELSETQLADVKRWYRCLLIVGEHEVSGHRSLTDEECQFVVDVLEEQCPNLESSAYRQVYEECRQRLASKSGPPAIASTRSP